MEAFLISTSVVALAEVGDKTQLLAFILAARYRRPWPIIAGIFLATVLNHAGAAAIGQLLNSWLTPEILRWVLGVSFLAMAAWILVPDKMDDEELPKARWGVLGATFVAFFMAEMGDKTQIATVMLGAQYESVFAVVLGTTLGMMIANVPAVLLGDKIANALPVHRVHQVAAAIFALLGVFTLLGFGQGVGL
jgi:Ca2+/H+ antiporter, TMEM165/GDT1 family